MVRALQRDEILHQRLGLLARQLAAGGAEMPEPAKSVKLARPPVRRRRDLERRLDLDLGQPSGEAQMSVIELGGKARVRGPELLRRQQQLLGAGSRIGDARHAREHEAAKRARAAEARGGSACAALEGLRVSRHSAFLQAAARRPIRRKASPCIQRGALSGGGRFRSSPIRHAYSERTSRVAKKPSMPLHSGDSSLRS